MSDTPGRGYLPPTVPAPGPHRRQWPPPAFNFHYSQWQSGKQFIMTPLSPQSESMDLSSRTELNGSDINGTGVSVIASNPLLGEEKPSRLQPERVFDPKPTDQFISSAPKVFSSIKNEENISPGQYISSAPKVFPSIKTEENISPDQYISPKPKVFPSIKTEENISPFTAEVKNPNFSSGLKASNPPVGLTASKIPSEMKAHIPLVDVRSLTVPSEVKLPNPSGEIKAPYLPGALNLVNPLPDVKPPCFPSEDKLPKLNEKNVPCLSTDVKMPITSAESNITHNPSENKVPAVQPDMSNSKNLSTDKNVLNCPADVNVPRLSVEPKKPNPPIEVEAPNHSNDMKITNPLVETLEKHSAQINVTNFQSKIEKPETSVDLRVYANNAIEKELHEGMKDIHNDNNSSSVESNPLTKSEEPLTNPVCSKVPALDSIDDKIDHVESLLENMFQGEEKQSVIVTNNSRPVLTEDKVVEILQDNLSPVKVEIPVKEEVKEDPVVELKEEPKENQFMEIESELEKMFAGIEEEKPPALSINDSSMLRSKKPKRPSKPRQRKSTDSVDTKKRKAKSERPVLKKTKREKENSNDSVGLSRNVRGPYIHIKGPKENPSYVSVVNSGGKEEEEKERWDRRKHQSLVEGRLKGTNLYSSTLSSKYNSQSIDPTWVCTFCKQRAHCEGGLGGEPAGDLFGPYILNVPKPGDIERGVPNDRDVSAEQKKKGGGKAASLRSVGAIDAFINNMSKKSKKCLQAEEIAGEKEIWVHEKCAVWAPGVYLAGSHLIGLAEAISSAAVTKCTVCGAYGACVGCVRRNCSGRVHYGCGLSSGWLLNEEDFNSLCSTHSLKKENIKNVT